MDSATTYSLLISLLVVIATFAGGFWAYNQGYLDPIIEKVGVYLLRAKAMAEAKQMQAQGMKAGEDFVGSQLKGNQQAEELKAGVGSIGGLKKQL